MQPLVSIIVPVYKVEKYLYRCLYSLSRQSLKNIEVLLIDDASPDRCGEICEQYAAQDTRFKVFHHTKNRGLSVARNTGIRQATADYLMFVDSDDWVHDDFCKMPYECAVKNHVDLVMFGYQQTAGKIFTTKANVIETIAEGLRTKEEAVDLTFTRFGMVAWNKLYHKNLFNTICYPEKQLYEDTATTYKLIWNASRIYCLDTILYYYFRHYDSITMQKETRKSVNEKFAVCWQQCCDLAARGFHSEQYELFKFNLTFAYCMKTPINFSDPFYAISADVMRCTKKTPPGFSWKQKLLFKLFQRSPKMFNLVCALWKKQVH